jgi:glycerol-3-phosphate acyltransferase PlsY
MGMSTPSILVASYLIGSIPFGLLFGKSITGKDPRSGGSGNIGFTNVLRVAGLLPAGLTLLGDFGKGVLAAFLGRYFAGIEFGLLAGLFCILGHCYPVFLRFRGGKAIATSFGVLSILYPLVALLTFGIWLVTVIGSRYVSLGSLVAFTCLPLIVAIFDGGFNAILTTVAITVLVYLRHRENITRLLLRKENKAF